VRVSVVAVVVEEEVAEAASVPVAAEVVVVEVEAAEEVEVLWPADNPTHRK
jgi:hypothetical protein